MSLRWDFKRLGGTITCKQGEKEYTHNWYEGNALMIVLNEWKEGDSDMYSLNWFFADADHAKNCFGISKGHENIFDDCTFTALSINRKYCTQWKKICDLFSKVYPDCVITLNK